MAIECTYIESRFGALWVGQTATYNEYEVGISGTFPNTPQIPTVTLLRDLIEIVHDFNPDALEQFTSFNNLSFASMEDVTEALNSDLFNLLVTDVYWLWGAPDVGGLGAAWNGEELVFLMINGFEKTNDLYHTGYGSNQWSPHLGATTVIEQDEHNVLLNPVVPPAGEYDNAISFYYDYDWDENLKTLVAQNKLFVSFNTIISSKAGYMDLGGVHEESFTETWSYLGGAWQWCFDNSQPPDNVIERNPWVLTKRLQYRMLTLPNYFIDLNRPYVEGTNVFGGESSVIDKEGNPYEVVDTGGGGVGGGGTQERYSQDTLPEGHPSLTLLNSGFVKLYNPNIAQLQNFAHFLFSGITEEMSILFKRMISNPLDYIIALNMIHIPLTTGATEEIGFCGVGSNVSAAVVTEQYYEIEYTLEIKEFWNTALDYSSYTKCRIYIPYCGIYDVNIDEFQNGSMWLRYVVDAVSGSVVAFLGTKRLQKSGVWLRATLYQFNGNCILSMPVSSTNWQNVFSSVLNIASMAIAPSPASVGGMANDIMSQKVSVQKSGSISANFGYLGKQTPYVILERPELSIPVDYGKHFGYPSNRLVYLGGCHGFTAIDTEQGFIAEDIGGITPQEADELKSLLSNGVYFPN